MVRGRAGERVSVAAPSICGNMGRKILMELSGWTLGNILAKIFSSLEIFKKRSVSTFLS